MGSAGFSLSLCQKCQLMANFRPVGEKCIAAEKKLNKNKLFSFKKHLISRVFFKN
jgi:hypothetical protein